METMSARPWKGTDKKMRGKKTKRGEIILKKTQKGEFRGERIYLETEEKNRRSNMTEGLRKSNKQPICKQVQNITSGSGREGVGDTDR